MGGTVHTFHKLKSTQNHPSGKVTLEAAICIDDELYPFPPAGLEPSKAQTSHLVSRPVLAALDYKQKAVSLQHIMTEDDLLKY